ncbi:hypothetical protein [uncultured Flavobacterium sp.]|uniref:hypothetical protein n=1 Tax=uncultured Flavobacterium sp. TaxID=165435 RepID=UPI0030EF0D04|tara:strand:+ start:52526 stop:53773 length:1248 start_codon:yes stop_codon:yes gene_type:complete
MKLNFLDSGLDSLKKGFQHLIEYEKTTFYLKEDNNDVVRFYHLKDAILFIQHGIEILVKSIIQNHSEYLIFSQIDSNVKAAIRQKNEQKLNSVFESDLKHKIHTVTFLESIERLKIIPNVKISKELEKRLKELESYRNIIMHSEPHLNEYDINETFDGLSDELDLFFSQSIGKKYKMISGYDSLTQSMESFKEIYKEKGFEHKIKTVEIILSALKKAKISLGSNEVKRITNVNNCFEFLKEIINSELNFGTDLYNGYCSGAVKEIIRKEDNIFALYTADNNNYYEFKLKSIIIYIPAIGDDKSPIVFIESDDIDYIPDNFENSELDLFDNIKTLRYLKLIDENKFIYNKEEVYSFQENNKSKKYEDYTRFFTKGLFCFLNVQGLKYNRGYKSLIWKEKSMNGKELEVGLRDILTK